MKRENNQTDLVLAIAGILPVIWLGLLMAPFFSGGLMEVIEQFPKAMEHPFQIRLCKDSMKTVLIFLLSYAMGIGIYISTKRRYRRGEEHGSAKWGDAFCCYN